MAAEGFLRSDRAPAPRTLARRPARRPSPAHGDAPAIDDGSTVLTYRELLEAVRAAAAGLAGAGIGPGDRVGVRIPSGTAELYTAILAVLAAGAAYVPVDVDDPDERARTVFREAGVARVLTEGDLAGAAAHRGAAPPGARRRRLDHLHLGLHRRAQGRRGHAPVGRRVRRRRGAAVPARTRRSAPATACWPGCPWRSTRAARRCGSRGRTAPAWSRRRARWCAPAWTSARGWSRRASPSSRPSRRSPGCGAPRSWPACGCSSSAARRARPSSWRGWWGTGARSGTRTGRRRRPSSRARRC